MSYRERECLIPLQRRGAALLLLGLSSSARFRLRVLALAMLLSYALTILVLLFFLFATQKTLIRLSPSMVVVVIDVFPTALETGMSEELVSRPSFLIHPLLLLLLPTAELLDLTIVLVIISIFLFFHLNMQFIIAYLINDRIGYLIYFSKTEFHAEWPPFVLNLKFQL